PASEGYVVIALDDPRYLDLAANTALSIRRADTRPVSVVVNTPVPDAYAGLFERVIVAEPREDLRGAMAKLRLPEFTPYARTLYLDADCLVFSPRIAFF